MRVLRVLKQPGPLGVVVALAAGIAMFAAEIDRQPFDAFWRAAATAAAVLVFAAVAKTLWKGQDVTEAKAGPLAVKFEERTEEALKTINDRLYDQMQDINERFHEIERRLARNEDAEKKPEKG